MARGLLAETYARLLARPVSLDYHERRCLTFVTATMSLATTVLSTDPRYVLATVELMLDRRTGRWVLTFRDRLIATGRYLPSPSALAELVADEHDRRRRTGSGSTAGSPSGDRRPGPVRLSSSGEADPGPRR